MAHIVTDDNQDTVVVKERATEVEREPVRTTPGLNIGGIILAVVIIIAVLYLFTGIL